MGQKNYRMLRSVWFWFIATTVIYVGFNLAEYPKDYPTLLGYVAGFIGLFVPFGILSSILVVVNPLYGAAQVGTTLIILICTDLALNKKEIGLGKRIFLNLIILLVITTIVDIFRLMPFESWKIFLNGSFSDLGF